MDGHEKFQAGTFSFKDEITELLLLIYIPWKGTDQLKTLSTFNNQWGKAHQIPQDGPR